MLRRCLWLAIALVLLPAAARAQNSAAVAGLAFYSTLMTGACALFVAGAKEFEDETEDTATETSYTRRGFYIEGGFAYAHGFPGNAGGPRIHAGFRCHDRFAADLEYEGLYAGGLHEGPKRETDSSWRIAYNGKLFLARGRVQPFLVFGFGVASFERRFTGTTNTDVLIDAGVGVDAWMTPSIALSLDSKYTALSGGASDLGHLSIGAALRYKF